MAPAAAVWFDKAGLAGQLARNALDAGNLPGAANRAYYSLHAHVTGLLMEAGLEPPIAHGNWPHVQMPLLIRRQFKTFPEKRRAMRLYEDLLAARVLADYGDHNGLSREELADGLRQLGIVVGSRWR